MRHSSLDDRFDPAVRIVDYDPAWPEMAAAEMARIEAALGEQTVQIDHVGSTAVPGMAAKPIVDLQASVAAIEPTERYARPPRGAITSSATWPCATTCVPIQASRCATQR